jgi:serine/threonine-protein kinase
MGLTLGTVTQEYSNSVKKGYVIDQGIDAGESVNKGTAVSIVISLGPQPTETVTTEATTEEIIDNVEVEDE